MIKKTLLSIIKYPLTFVFATFVFISFAAYGIGETAEFSPMENRYLADKPHLSISGVKDATYMTEFESYVKDQLPLRDVYIRGKAFLEVLMLKDENNGIARGKDGYLFEKNVGTSGNLSKNIAAIDTFVKNTDRDIYVAIAPTSVEILADKLPYGLHVLDEHMAMETLSQKVSGYNNVHLIDFTDALIKAADESQVYYKTDHHWTTDGAYVAYNELSKIMGLKDIDLSLYNRHDVGDFYGTYYAKYKGNKVIGDTLSYYDIPVKSYIFDGKQLEGIYDESKLSEYDKYAMFMYGNPGEGTIESGVCDNGRTLIILKDSYANCLIPFLMCSYEKIISIDLRYYGGSVKEIIDDNEADILLLYNWSFVNEDNHFYKMVK